MLNRLSSKYQKDIAFGFIALFLVSGIGSLKAAEINYHSYSVNTYQHFGKNKNIEEKAFSTNDLAVNRTQNTAMPGKKSNIQADVKHVNLFEVKKAQTPFIGGPSQPEMSAFKSVGADNMVSPFTGDFSYNIPLLDVGGYPVNMFYNSGITMDEEASWVGLGWNINPGTITRNMRGLPDDFDGTDSIIKRQSIRPDKTWGVSAGAGIKFAGFPLTKTGLDISSGLSFNNKLGVAIEAGIHPALSISSKAGDKKTNGLSYGATVGVDLNLNSRSGANVTPSISFDRINHQGTEGDITSSIGAGYTYNSRLGVTGMHIFSGVQASKREEKKKADDAPEEQGGPQAPQPATTTRSGSILTHSSGISFLYPTITPSVRNIFTRRSYSLSFSLGGEASALNPHARISGYYTETFIDPVDKETKHPAYGVLYYQKGNEDAKALLDFNRANEGVYTPNSPSIAMPIYTYDVFSINGEGTGGSFKATRSDLGYMRDGYVKTKDNSGSLGLDLGFGALFHGGAEITYAYSPTEVSEWKLGNMVKNVFQFKNNDTSYQAVYFRNPGERTIPDVGYQNAICGEELVRLKLGNIASGTPTLLPTFVKYDAGKNKTGELPLTAQSVLRPNRDKRTQVINFLTADEAERVGFDKKIYTYDTDSTKIIFGRCDKLGIDSIDRYSADKNKNYLPEDRFRKANHISEIDVLGTDGRKYVYGLPVYNTRQVDVSFSIENGDNSTGKSTYEAGTDDGNDNTKGRDWYMQQEETPAYAHSFLLTALTSPNYVDVTGNGITEDDMGDAVKFNYSRFSQGYKWRTPIGNGIATYSEGLKTDNKDDKAHYIYGTREMYYLYSIESKNMVARFYVKNDRKDGRQVQDQNGSLDNNWGMQRLDKICLYSKGDLLKLGNNAKPIKTVRFFQSYKLCKNTDGSSNIISGYGKLTLDSIWISYNGNQKKAKTKYVFYYPEDKNPDYNYNSNDRWGNYKPITDGGVDNNPGGLNNADYPYSVQDKTKADKYAAAWTMNKILLPSGGVINVEYESDDYAYVQNKKAASMCQVLGFGNTASPTVPQQTNALLYSGSYENEFVYIKLPYAITGSTDAEKKRELAARYFQDINQLYMKLAVIVPPSPGLSGSELVSVYADIDDYGLVASDIAYVKVKRLENGSTPMVQQALQFLKQQLPGKAYKGFDVSESGGIKSVLLAIAGMRESIKALKMGDDNMLKANHKCQEAAPAKSFVRLSNPYEKKYGGGLRVKKVIINDNWNKMTNQYEATYGQEYRYTTQELINGKQTVISSGVASWEPSIGSDENPHKEIMRFMDHNKKGPYDFGAIEMPLGEVFYPSPLVGYSRVEVLSIHRDTVKNLPTRQVTEFFTTKDFPFKSSCTQLTDPEANVKYEPSAIKQLLKIDMQKAITQSQGFLVEMNDMNGKMKTQATYSALDSINPVSSTTNYYNTVQATDKTFTFNHSFPVINKPDGIISNSTIGRDIEIMADFRQHSSRTVTANLSINFDFFPLGIFPIALNNLLQPVVFEGTCYRSASLLKIVNHYSMVDSVVVVDRGSTVSTKNLVYDAETGNPILTRTNNEHNKPIYNFSYPAHWAYSGMGPAYKNIDAIYTGLTFRHGILEGGHMDMGIFESGDELYVLSQKNGAVPAMAPCDASPGTDAWTTLQKNEENRIWVVNTAKANSANPQFVFMDKHGNPYNAVGATIKIIRSGHRNMLDQTVGSITSMNNPINSSGQLVFNDATGIIQTGVATFKDHWKVDNSFYRVDSVVDASTFARVRLKTIPLKEYLNGGDHQFNNGSPAYTTTSDPFITAYHWGNRHGGGGGLKPELALSRGFLLFDYGSGLSPDAKFYKAFLSLYSHTDINRNFPTGVSANHPNLHSHTWSYTSNLPAEVKSMKADWFALTNTSAWGNTYLNLFSDPNVSVSSGIVPNTVTGNEDYVYKYQNGGYTDNRISITGIVNESSASTLAQQGKLGLRINLNADNNFDNSPDKFRCFWTKPEGCSIAEGFSGGGEENVAVTCTAVSPKLSYYYYICGDSIPVTDTTHDPYVNTLIRCDSATMVTTFCLSKFTRKAINPYVEGILGNWRVDSIYAYYGERKETDPLTGVDTRVAGSIINYKNFWNFNAAYLTRNTAASDVWVWNSTITQYNRKGYEIENKDPLGRFNSGLYGYNQQLPVGVANNARVREIMYDGFEDYDYQTASDCINCKPHRHANFDTSLANSIDATQRHTGRYSLKLNAAKSIVLKAPVTSVAAADNGYTLRIKRDSVFAGSTTVVIPKGTGFRGKYYNLSSGFSSCSTTASNAVTAFASGTPAVTRQNEQLDLPYDFTVAGINPDKFAVRWEGYIQPLTSGSYSFFVSADDAYKVSITINGSTTVLANRWTCDWGTNTTTTPVTLTAGRLYKITMDYFDHTGHQFAQLDWITPGSNSPESIPKVQVYSPDHLADSAGTAITNADTWCTRLDSVNVRGNALTDTFSLLQNKKMLLSAWVKEGGNDCKCSTYVKNSITISYTGSDRTETMYSSGNIIEGWQRYEAVFTVPSSATAVTFSLNNTNSSGGAAVYFDDIRVQPFNANMKNFVYHSSNLRLMSELDENNYASFYEYDDDGTLTRVKKETDRGIKTISETRSAMQKVIQ